MKAEIFRVAEGKEEFLTSIGLVELWSKAATTSTVLDQRTKVVLKTDPQDAGQNRVKCYVEVSQEGVPLALASECTVDIRDERAEPAPK